jgi:hypothetical protein
MIAFGPIPGAQGGTPFGVVIDNTTHKAIVFNSSTNAVIGATAADTTSGGLEGDCTIVGNKVWFTNFNTQLHSATLSTQSLQGSAVSVVNLGEEVTSIKKRKRTFLITSDGNISGDPGRRLSVVDASTRHQVSTFDTGFPNFAAQRAPDGSILSADQHNVHRLVISKRGKLHETAGHGGFMGLNNFIMPKSGHTAIVLDFVAKKIFSLSLPSLQIIDSVALTNSPVTGAINPAGDIVYVQTNADVVPFSYNTSSGLFGSGPFGAITLTPNDTGFFGIDATAVNPQGTTLYVSSGAAVKTFNATTGALGPAITSADISYPLGICFPGQS